ncbi:putative membrane protein [Mycobacterium kansasii]|uniref:Putative membrane protein n=1 Tax=Mycobacterium kansasii TaxID=1768 RepID=A0A1V3WML2_MYCKA|nr:putative membrane protein [Mycobacterium kansasii]
MVMVSGLALVTLSVDGRAPEFAASATFFGIGAALVLDEYALILHLSDVYWEEDGRTSVDAVFAAVAVAGLLTLGFHPLMFVLAMWSDTHSVMLHAALVGGVVLTLPLAVVVLFKGKVWTGCSACSSWCC